MSVYKYISKSRKASAQKPLLTNIYGTLSGLSMSTKHVVLATGGITVGAFLMYLWSKRR